MGDIRVLLGFIIPLILIFCMIRKKFDTVFILMIAAVVSGLIVGLPLTTVLSTVKEGFGSVLSQVGLLVLFGMIFSEYLEASGGIKCMARFIAEKTSKKGSINALYVLGYAISIPVNFTAATTMVAPLIRRLSGDTEVPVPAYACAFSVSSFLTNCLVVPTLTPALLAGIAGIEIGPFMIIGIAISLIISLIAALGGAFLLLKKYGSMESVKETLMKEAAADEEEQGEQPGVMTVASLILLPILLIVMGTFAPSLLPEGSWAYEIISFIGDPAGALLLAIVVEMVVLRKYLDEKTLSVFTTGMQHAGGLLIILGAANSFGSVLTEGGIGDVLLDLLSGVHIPILLLAFLMVAILHAGTGVMTVAASATLPLLMPLVEADGGSMTLLVVACCLGCTALVLPNSTEFYIFSDAYKMNVRDTLLSISLPATVAGVAGIVLLLIFQSVVPLAI